MDITGRRVFLLSLIDAATQQHDRWASQPELTYITAGVDEAMTDLIDGWSEGSIPGDCRELQGLVGTFSNEWHDWQAEVDRRGAATIPPSEACWKAWEAVVDAYRGVSAPPRPPIESVAILREQKVPDRQICEIYGWVTPHGQPETWKVEEEVAEPGKHTTGWKDPITRRREEAAEKEQALAAKVKQLRARKMARMNQECPESLEDLIHQNVPLHQVAEMLRMTQNQVLAECETRNLPRPPVGPSVNAIRGDFEPDLPEPMARQEAAQNAERDRKQAMEAMEAKAEMEGEGGDLGIGIESSMDGSPLSLEHQIINLHLQGFEAMDIASELTNDNQNNQKVSRQKVQAVVKRYESDPEVFAVPTG